MRHVRSRLMGWLASGLVLAVSGWAAAQQTTEVRTRETRTTRATTGVRRVSDVIGSTVRLRGEDRYGKIDDIVLNDAGCVEYLVISHDDDYILVPWTVTTVDYEERIITLDTTPERLETLTFERDNWPSPSDRQFTRRVEEVFGASALRREGRGGGGNVRGREDREDGTVRSRSTDRSTRDDDETPSARPQVRDVTPRATGRSAPDGPSRVREITPGDAGRTAPDDRSGVREATPRATDRTAPDDRPGTTPRTPDRRTPGDPPPTPGTTPTAPGAPTTPGAAPGAPTTP